MENPSEKAEISTQKQQIIKIGDYCGSRLNLVVNPNAPQIVRFRV